MKTDNQIYGNDAFFETVKNYDKIIIFRHVNPDPDALGAQNALAYLLCKRFPSKQIKCAGATPDNLKWMDDLMDPLYEDMLRENPAKNKDIDSDFKDSSTLGIVLDTANTERIDGDWEGIDLFKIDHHPAEYNDHYENEYINTNASSTSELIADLFEFTLYTSEDDELLASLYAGIAGDTGRFMYNNTTSHTLLVVGTVLENLSPDYRYTINTKLGSINEYQANLMGYAYDRRYYLNDNVVSLIIPYSQIRGGHEADAYVTIGALQRLEKPEIAVVVVENEDGSYRIHLRSKSKSINALATKYNGGGHPLAAGAKAKDRDEVAKLFHELAEEW